MINIILGLVLLAIIGFFVWEYFLNKPQTTKLTEQPKKETNKTLPKKKFESFIPMPTWNGHKQNYVFKTDKMGTGYYLDKKVSFKNVEVQNYDPNAPPVEIAK